MIRRTIEVGSAAHLCVDTKQLIIQNDAGKHSVPFEDIGFLILDNPQITCSQSVFRHCAKHNIALIITDETHLPTAMLFSLEAHSTQGKVMRMQVATPEEVNDFIWQQIIRAKINMQAMVLDKVHKVKSARLLRLAKTVELGDANNHEAQAARLYFQLMFGKDFRREPKSLSGANIFLNYGYSLIRSACSRALMGAGLHPAFGIHHHNQYNVFCLADDIMEPLRPRVDQCVAEFVQTQKCDELNRDAKDGLLEILSTPVLLKRRKLPLMSALSTYCASLRKVLEKRGGKLDIPVLYDE